VADLLAAARRRLTVLSGAMLSTTVNGESLALTEKHWLDDTCISITAAATSVLSEVIR